MADTGKNSPLGVNVTGSTLNHNGYNINPVAASYMGASKTNYTYSFGSIVQNTCLRLLTWAIHDGYNRGILGPPSTRVPTLTTTTYDNLISIGASTIPALGNAKPPTYVVEDPSGVWTDTSIVYGQQTNPETDWPYLLPGPATSGYGNYDPTETYGDTLQGYGLVDQKQNATWYPYNSTNINHSVTQWGWVRCHALQAWNEFNWNGNKVVQDPPQYNDFTSSFNTANAYVNYTNQAILAAYNAITFMDGAYSNMNDLVSADIAGVSLSSKDFGTDLINLGKAFNISKLDAFGLPSTLLETLGTNNAVTPDLSLALLASGLVSDEINALTSGTARTITPDQERKIYGAFLIITGANLAEILAPLQCVTQGLTSLADLLNVKKMFPLSYTSLTVPKYNATPGPTNSKTYYLIYDNGAVNPALDTPDMREYVGIQVPKGTPPVLDRTAITTDPNNYGPLPIGFGAYAKGIIPDDQAVAAGALSFTMRQIRKIEQVDFKKFAKVAQGMENMQSLPLTTGTSKPTNQESIDTNRVKGALGSGPYGTFTMSDMFGCMSGLPYPWKKVYNGIRGLETQKLYNIYHELFLAVTWQGASVTVVPETRQVPIPDTDPVQYQTEYRVASFVVAGKGGGYGRGTAPDAIITADNGATGTGVVGRSDGDAASLGGGSFGRITGATLTDPGAWQLTVPTATIQFPPTATLPVDTGGAFATDGANTPNGTTGWSAPMNAVVSAYIQQANDEITAILQRQAGSSKLLNTYWDILGTQLKIEQRARYFALVPVPVPKDMFLNPFHISLYNYTDNIPELAQDTRPHMSAQTLEAISNMSTVGGQSTVGGMRQERNQRRLQQIGIDQDNNIPDKMSEKEVKTLTTNGVMPGAKEGTGIPYGNTGIEYTIPAWPASIVNGREVSPTPNGIFDPTGYAGEFLPTAAIKPGGIESILQGDPIPTVSTVVPSGPVYTPGPEIPIIQSPKELSVDNLPANLNPNYTATTLLPASPTIQDAIDQVIECNCDCWID